MGVFAGFVCTATVEEKVSFVQLAQGVLGAALYWWAGPLSHSMFFRLSAGSLGFMLLSVLILIFVLSRCAPTSWCSILACTRRLMFVQATLISVLYICHVHCQSEPQYPRIYTCLVCRALPNKRGMGAAFAVLGSTFTGLMRYCFGRWIPTFEQLMYSKVSLHLSNDGDTQAFSFFCTSTDDCKMSMERA